MSEFPNADDLTHGFGTPLARDLQQSVLNIPHGAGLDTSAPLKSSLEAISDFPSLSVDDA